MNLILGPDVSGGNEIGVCLPVADRAGKTPEFNLLKRDRKAWL